MTRSQVKGLFIGFAVAISTVVFAATFDYFSPATGVLKGNASSYVTTAAASSDIRALWSGTCNGSSFLRGDGACAATGTVTSVGLTMPAGFSVGGSPVTSTGTLAVTTALSGVIHGNGSGFTASNVVLTSEVSGILPVANGGIGIASGTSGGIPYFNSTTSIASSGLLTASALLLGGGAGTSPTALGSLGTTTTVLHGNAAGAPTFGAVSLTADITGTLPVANGGTNLTASADDNVMVGNGTTWETKAVPDCDNSGSNHLNYDTGTNAFTCGTSPIGARASVTCDGVSCTLVGTSNFGVSSVTRNAEGIYTVNLNAGFTDEPVCVVALVFSTDYTTIATMGTTTTTTAVVSIGVQGTAMTTEDGDFNIICQGL
jgi:hypothetical protein